MEQRRNEAAGMARSAGYPEEGSGSRERRRLMLLARAKFFDLWVEHYGRLRQANRQRLPIQAVCYLAR